MAFGHIPNRRAALSEDIWLEPYREALRRRVEAVCRQERRLTGGTRSLADIASGHEHFGLHRDGDGWVFREWAPNATDMHLMILGELAQLFSEKAVREQLLRLDDAAAICRLLGDWPESSPPESRSCRKSASARCTRTSASVWR